MPPLAATWRRLVSFSAAYFRSSLGEMALMVLPPELRQLDAVQWQRRRKRLDKLLAEPQPEVPTPPLPEMTEQQAAALAILAQAASGQGGKLAPYLLWRSTGSGKTEVYLRQAQHTIDQGRQVLLMVPESNLTPQLEARVAERLVGRRIVSLHSGLTPAQRLRHWLMAHLGLADVVLGTRLSVFTPLPRLGLIIVDEEHDPSYKQQEGVRYSARDVAVWRAHHQGVPIVLGTATPSLESWRHASEGRYRHLRLTRRAVATQMPTVRLIDTRRAKLDGGLSKPLIEAIGQRLARREQSLIFLNRRGFAPGLARPSCEWVSACPHCAANRVVHLADRRLRCHHCGFDSPIPVACPDCGEQDLQPLGRGTQKLEAHLAERFPEARVLRVDRDVARSR